MAMKFYISVAKGLKLKVRVLGANSYAWKLGGGGGDIRFIQPFFRYSLVNESGIIYISQKFSVKRLVEDHF